LNAAEILDPVLSAGIIILLTWLIARLAGVIIGRLMSGSIPLAAAQAKKVVWILIWAIGAILAIEQLGVRSDILLLVVGLFGAGVIVALRVPFENLGAKYFSDIYVPFKVGDSILVDEYSGKVVEINSMCTILLSDKDNQLVSIPNSILVRDVVTNSTPQAWKELAIPISIGNSIDLATFESEVLKSVNKLKLRLDKRFPPLMTTKSGNSQSTELVLTVMIRSPEDRDAVANEINKRVAEIIQKMQGAKKSS
jgi:small conductance mechanosensitive channel